MPSDEEYQQLELAIGMPPEIVRQSGWRGTSNESRKLKAHDVDSEWTEKKKAQVNASGFPRSPVAGR